MIREKISVWAMDPKRPTRTTLVEHEIDTGDAPPVRSGLRRHSPAEAQHITAETTVLNSNGLIRPSRSLWSSPVVLVRKKDGALRFAIDYRKLNKVTKRETFPIPRVDDALSALSGCKFFSTLDLASGYWQVPVREEDKHKTAFITHEGLWEWNVLPFGLMAAPYTFMRLMDATLAGINYVFALCYIDDILVFSPTFEKHLSDLAEVFDRLIRAGLSLRASKCHLCCGSVDYLGHTVNAEGIEPSQAKIRAIQDWPPPTSTKQVESFLGLCGFYRKFIKNYSAIARPLEELKARDAPTFPACWTARRQLAFMELKKALTSKPILRHPNFNLPFFIVTDASDYGIGAVLSQRTKQGEHAVVFASRSLSKRETSYATAEKECLAVIWALDQFRSYIRGRPITVYTDHRALVWLLNTNADGGRLGRWILRLQEYEVEIKHRPGKKNQNADALSRVPVGPPVDTEDVHPVLVAQAYPASTQPSAASPARIILCDKCTRQFKTEAALAQHKVDMKDKRHTAPAPAVKPARTSRKRKISKEAKPTGTTNTQLSTSSPSSDSSGAPTTSKSSRTSSQDVLNGVPVTREMWQNLQSEDILLEPMIIFLRSGELPLESKQADRVQRTNKAFELEEGMLVRKVDSRRQVVVPKAMQRTILRLFHDNPIAGHGGRYKTYMRIFQRFYWDKLWNDVKRYVSSCNACQLRKPAPQHSAGKIQRWVVPYPFHTVAVDLVGPLPETKNEHKYVITMMDLFTGWVEMMPLRDVTAESVAHAFYTAIVCRHSTPTRVLSDCGAQFLSDVFKTLCKWLGATQVQTSPYHPATNGKLERFHRFLGAALSICANKQKNDWDLYLPSVAFAHRTAPIEGSDLTPFYLIYGRHPRFPLDFTNEQTGATFDIQRSLDRAYQSLAEVQQRLRQRQDLLSNKTRKDVGYKVGDIVQVHHAGDNKLQPRWTAPHRIVAKIGATTFRVQHLGTLRTQSVHVSRLRLHFLREEDASSSQDADLSPAFPAATPATIPQAQPAQPGKIVDTPVSTERLLEQWSKIAEQLEKDRQLARRLTTQLPTWDSGVSKPTAATREVRMQRRQSRDTRMRTSKSRDQ
jgi:transposase InsO family protein